MCMRAFFLSVCLPASSSLLQQRLLLLLLLFSVPPFAAPFPASLSCRQSQRKLVSRELLNQEANLRLPLSLSFAARGNDVRRTTCSSQTARRAAAAALSPSHQLPFIRLPFPVDPLCALTFSCLLASCLPCKSCFASLCACLRGLKSLAERLLLPDPDWRLVSRSSLSLSRCLLFRSSPADLFNP